MLYEVIHRADISNIFTKNGIVLFNENIISSHCLYAKNCLPISAGISSIKLRI